MPTLGETMSLEQMIYREMAILGEDVLIGNVETLKKFGIHLHTNNWLKRHGLPMRRKYHGRRK